MAILDRANKSRQKPVETPVETGESIENEKVDTIGLSVDELEFLIRLIGEGTFKGNNIMFIYDLVKKLQDEYLIVNGGNK